MWSGGAREHSKKVRYKLQSKIKDLITLVGSLTVHACSEWAGGGRALAAGDLRPPSNSRCNRLAGGWPILL